MIVIFPDHTHFLYSLFSLEKKGILILNQSPPSVHASVCLSVTLLINVSPPKLGSVDIATSNFVAA